MSDDKLQQLEQRTLAREADYGVDHVARTIPLADGTAAHLAKYMLDHRDPDCADLRIAGATHLTAKEWLRRQLRGPWSFLTEAKAQPSTPAVKASGASDGCPSYEDIQSGKPLTAAERDAAWQRVRQVLGQ